MPFDPSIPNSVFQPQDSQTSFGSIYQPSNRIPPVPPRKQIGNDSQNSFATGSYFPNQSMFPSYGLPSSFNNLYGTNTNFTIPNSSFWNAGGLGSSANYYPNDPNNFSLSSSLDLHLRPTLDTVSNVIQAINSLTMMVQSCFMAVYTSCRAVVSMADQLGRFSDKVLAFLARIKPLFNLRRLLIRILNTLKLKKILSGTPPLPDGVDELAWRESQRRAANLAHIRGGEDALGNWVSMLFFLITMGLPLLIWRVIKSLDRDQQNSGKRMKAIFSFTARNADELSLNSGEIVCLVPKVIAEVSLREEDGWYLVKNAVGKIGLVPSTYIVMENDQEFQK